MMPVVTVACYTMWFVRHCHSSLRGGIGLSFCKLHSFTGSAADVDVQWERTVLLCYAMMDFMFGM